jgi:hypothetical protein
MCGGQLHDLILVVTGMHAVRHPLANIVAMAKWHITGSHTKVVTKAMLDKYLHIGTFRYRERLPHSVHLGCYLHATYMMPSLSSVLASLPLVKPDNGIALLVCSADLCGGWHPGTTSTCGATMRVLG